MVDAQKNLPYGLGQQMSPELVNAWKLFSASNLMGLYSDFMKMLKGEEDNIFSKIFIC